MSKMEGSPQLSSTSSKSLFFKLSQFSSPGKKAWFVCKNRKLNFVYTSLLFFNNFAFGISVNLVGATLVDLSHLYALSLRQTILVMLVANSVGYLLGALSAALVLTTSLGQRLLNRQLLLAAFSSLIAVTSLFVPHYFHTWVLCGAMLLNGMGGGAWDAAHTAFLVDMWPEVGENGPVLQANQFFYSVGCTISPLLASGFIFGEAKEYLLPVPFPVISSNSGEILGANLEISKNETVTRILTQDVRQRHLAVPFAVNGVLQFVAPALLFLFYFLPKYRYKLPSTQAPCKPKPKNSLTGLDCVNLNNLNSTFNSSSKIRHRKLKLVLCGLCIAAYFTAETGYFPYCTAMFQYLEIGLTASEAAQLTSVLSFFYTIGPFISAFVSIWVSPDTILVYHYGCLLGGFSLLALGHSQLPVLYGSNVLVGYGFSAVIPALYSFVQRHFGLDDRVCGLFSFASGAVSLAIPLALVLGDGEATFRENPLLLLYLQLIFIALSLVVFVILRLWIWLEKRR